MTETLRRVVGSREWIEFPISAEADPTSFPVEVALVPTGTIPLEADYRAASWGLGGGPDVWGARLLIGDAGSNTDYDVGVYDAFVRIDSGAEEPILFAGGVEIIGETAPRIIDVEDLGDFLGQDIPTDDAQADLACDIAGRVVRSKLRQTVTFVADDEVAFEGVTDDRIRLPERPVVEVSSVTVDGATFPDTGYSLIGEEIVLVPDSGTWASIASGLGSFGGRGALVVVVYSHGFAVVPDDIRGLALSIASRIYRNPAGATSESILSYSVAYGQDFPLSPWEDAVVGQYRRRSRSMSTR
jgi:hypothetical protein